MKSCGARLPKSRFASTLQKIRKSYPVSSQRSVSRLTSLTLSHRLIKLLQPAAALLLAATQLPTFAGGTERSPYLSNWFHQSIGVIGSSNIRFGPFLTSDVYLEYEYFGSKGPFDLYGYVDMPRAFGLGSTHDAGITNGGSPVFGEQEPRLSLDRTFDTHLGFGPFKEWYLAADWIYDQGGDSASHANTLYAGIGTDIATPGPLILSANFYARRQWANYGAPNENTWDGWRAQMKYIVPLGNYGPGHLTFVGFFNYDFGSHLGDLAGDGSRTNTSFVATNVLAYEFTHWRFWGAARYFNNGGQWAGTTLNFGQGDFQNQSTGWGYYASVGYWF